MKTPKELALLAARALSDKKGKEIRVMEIAELTTLADYFVLATGASNTQINALVDNVEKVLAEEAGEQPLHREAIAAARGCCWTTAASPSMCSIKRPGPSTAWSVCGRTARAWTSAALWRSTTEFPR